MAGFVEAFSTHSYSFEVHHLRVRQTRVMNEEQQLKLQAFFDGELSEKEAKEVASWLARDREATELHAELRNTRKALTGFEPGVRVPESREFYWSKIEREIHRLEPAPEPQRVRSRSVFAILRRFLIPAGALAALAAAVLVARFEFEGSRPSGSVRSEMTISDSGTFTYQDFAHGTTLVWLSYPAER